MLEERQANRCRQIHVQKSTEKAKQQHTHPPQNTHTPTSASGHHPPNHSGSRVGRRSGGKEAVVRSWHWIWLTASGSVPASQPLPSWWAPRAEGCRSPSPVLSLFGRARKLPHSSCATPEAKRAAGAICGATLQCTTSSGGFAQLGV